MSSTLQLRLSAALDAELQKAEQRNRARKTPIDRFHDILHQGRQGEPPNTFHVVSSDVMRSIQRNTHPSGTRRHLDLYEQYAGVCIIEKTGQKSPCLAFRTREDADRYLAGEFTEEQLITPANTPS